LLTLQHLVADQKTPTSPLPPVLELREGGGISPNLPIVVPGTITALLVLYPFKKGINIEKGSFFNANPPLYFFANSSTESSSPPPSNILFFWGSILIIQQLYISQPTSFVPHPRNSTHLSGSSQHPLIIMNTVLHARTGGGVILVRWAKN